MTRPIGPRPAILRRTALALFLAVVGATIAGCGSGPPGGTDAATDPTRETGADRAERLDSTRQALASTPNDPELLFDLASLHARGGDADSALVACERILARDDHHDAALSLWSKLLFEAGRHQEAIARLEATRTEREGLPDALRAGLALHYDAVGAWENSAREFAAVDTPNSAKVYHVLRGEDFLEAGDLAAAALEREPSAASHNNYGITRLYVGDAEGARTAFLRALELDPELPGAYYNLAIVDAFYFFDEDGGRHWLERYRDAGGTDDPDGLGELLAVGEDDSIGEQARR